VGYVTQSSSAEAAGFLLGDTLLTMSGKRIKNWEQLVLEIAMHPEHAMEFVVGRPSGRETLTLVPEKKGREGIGWSGLYQSEKVVVEKILPSSSAEKAGILGNDTITKINGETIPGWDFLVEKIKKAGSTTVHIEVKREDAYLSFPVTPVYNEEYDRFMIGIQKGAVFIQQHYGPIRSFVKALQHTGRDALMIWKFLKALVTTRLSVKSMAGPVGIVHITGEMARSGIDVFLLFLAMISVNLAVINLFPFLIITDGGVIFFLIFEFLRGRPLGTRKQMMIQQVAVFLLIGFFIFITFNDIFRLIGRN
jgi:regulator of sigma E protease